MCTYVNQQAESKYQMAYRSVVALALALLALPIIGLLAIAKIATVRLSHSILCRINKFERKHNL